MRALNVSFFCLFGAFSQVAEVIMWNRILSTAEIQATNAYFVSAYGFAPVAAPPAPFAPYPPLPLPPPPSPPPTTLP